MTRSNKLKGILGTTLKAFGWLALFVGATATLGSHGASAAKVSDIASTVHNFTFGSPGSVAASSGNEEICVFCHTPHGAVVDDGEGANIPLWNRAFSVETYDAYTSTSLTAAITGNIGGSSKLCLSCHDGTIAIGSVNSSQVGTTIPGLGTTFATGSQTGGTSGFSANLGSDLRNDHPISFTYDTNASGDPQVESSGTTALGFTIGNRTGSTTPDLPLEGGVMQCATCHDPHVYDDSGINRKFLRLNRFQGVSSAGDVGSATPAFGSGDEIICIACHNKSDWQASVHAQSDEVYVTGGPTATRDFPDGLAVWQAACLNCHDTHTKDGAPRLLREGATDAAVAAQEETCYQCHTAEATRTALIVDQKHATAPTVPDIEGEFLRDYQMPFDTTRHDIQPPGGDLVELAADLNDRHVVCTDCHNPHRVQSGTHSHAGVNHTNDVSGALTGIWGVEPDYTDRTLNYSTTTEWDSLPQAAYTEKKPIEYEYQVCLKCHSSYAYGDSRPTTTTNYPTNDARSGDIIYTDQAVEFWAPSTHSGNVTGGGTGWITNNHRSWHPVMAPTGRNSGISMNDPWDNNIGSQTMYCTDCHGQNTSDDTSAPSGTVPWGPHGSDNPFILKGVYDNDSANSGSLCDRCHNPTSGTNFTSSDRGNLHSYHQTKVGLKCNWCHIAVPHGWRNRSLLSALPNVANPSSSTAIPLGERGGDSVSGGEDCCWGYVKAPYYRNVVARVLSMPVGGNNWSLGNCKGEDWMKNKCDGPP